VREGPLRVRVHERATDRARAPPTSIAAAERRIEAADSGDEPPRSRPLAWLAGLYLIVVGVLLLIGLVGTVESGPLAVVLLIVEHLAVAGLPFVLLALAITRSRAVAICLAVVVGLFGMRFGGEWVSLPAAAPAGPTLLVATWNLDYYQRTGPDAVAFLLGHPADLVALEELTAPVADAIAGDRELAATYPYQQLNPGAGATGAGLLSRYPLTDAVFASQPVRLEAHVRVPPGTIAVIAAHPFPARFRFRSAIPIQYDPTTRNADLSLLRERVDQLAAAGERTLLLGDFNTAPAEPAFGRLTAGLHDAHAEVGEGPGWTWRPEPLDFIGFGLLRIDLILSSGGLRPTSTSIACPVDGDHCLFAARLAIAPT
jgi:endonuclease/exonuclease/phosphatase family metal-dependent hydrolase